MNPAPKLEPGLLVRSEPPGAGEGRLGPLLIDEDRGILFALTPAQLLAPDSELVVARGPFEGATISVGPAIVGLASDGDLQPSHAMLAAVPLRRLPLGFGAYPAAIGGRESLAGISAPKGLRNSAGWTGQVLFVHSERGVFPARVVSADSQFVMPHPLSDQLVIFDNALELQPLGREPLIVPGEVGSLVMTAEGDWIAIIVAGRKEVAYAAPVEPVMSRLGLSIIGVAQIDRHNEQFSGAEKPSEPDSLTVNAAHRSESAREAVIAADEALAV